MEQKVEQNIIYPTRENERELEILGVPKIDSSNFTFDKWESCWWNLFDDNDNSSYVKFMENIEKHLIGFARGMDTPCRPKQNMYAVMVHVGDEDVWFHVDSMSFEMFFIERKRFYRVHDGFTT